MDSLTGLVTHYLLFFIDISSRSVHIAGITTHPETPWIMQVARHLTNTDDGFLRGKRYLILDRDTKYSDVFRSFLVGGGIKIIRLPPRSPNLNAFAERFMRSIKQECLDRMIFFGHASLRHAVKHFMAHYHTERSHQGLGNRLLEPLSSTALLRGHAHGASVSAECSATTTEKWPELHRSVFWTLRDAQRLAGPRTPISVAAVQYIAMTCFSEQ